jgi:hypothetical protein
MPPKATADQVITWVSSQIDMDFAAAGYKTPFVEITGETWLTAQTNFLALVTCLGTAAHLSGHFLKPAPAVAPGREGGSGNLFQDLFGRELRKIWDGRRTHLKWRADYYAGTPAEMAVKEPTGPVLDFMEGKFDPTRYEGFWDVTETMRQVQMEIKDLELEWDYLYDYESFNMGLGSVRYR